METEISNASGSKTPYRCGRCGVESPERSCFIIPERHSKPPHDTRCITCEQQRTKRSALEGVVALVLALSWPLLILAGSQRGSTHPIPTYAILLTLALLPASIFAHELGHTIAALILRLELSGMDIGTGALLFRIPVRGFPIRVNCWPICGCVYLGSKTLRLLRLRLWITTLAGPVTNAALLLLTTIYWRQLEPVTGSVALGLFSIVNFLLVVTSMIPYRPRGMGGLQRSDGLALIEIPRSSPMQLEVYVTSVPLMRAWDCYRADDNAGAKTHAAEALARRPGDSVAQTINAAALIGLEQYAAARTALIPMLEAAVSDSPSIRAMVSNALAVALHFENVLKPEMQSELHRASRLSREAHDRYPCVLEYRSTRALTLAATGDPETALTLLEYCHFDSGTPRQRGHRETTRAFACQRLGMSAAANRSLEIAIKLDHRNAKMFEVLGLTHGSG